jgi:hypothetical protein
MHMIDWNTYRQQVATGVGDFAKLISSGWCPDAPLLKRHDSPKVWTVPPPSQRAAQLDGAGWPGRADGL